MIVAPQFGFVLLAMPKCASTSLALALRPFAAISFQNLPAVRHLSYADFVRHVQPLLAEVGYPRDTYEVVSAIREPVSWLASWWRYRQREALADPSHPRHSGYTGEIPFDEFASAYMAGELNGIGKPSEFLTAADPDDTVDRLFQYERLAELVEFLEARIGRRLTLGHLNESPPATVRLSPDTERALRQFFQEEYALWQAADGTGRAFEALSATSGQTDGQPVQNMPTGASSPRQPETTLVLVTGLGGAAIRATQSALRSIGVAVEVGDGNAATPLDDFLADVDRDNSHDPFTLWTTVWNPDGPSLRMTAREP